MLRKTHNCPVNGTALKSFRQALNWSQCDLAVRSGYSERLIRKAEAGRPVKMQTIRDIADTLSTPQSPVSCEQLLLDKLEIAKLVTKSYDNFGSTMLLYCSHVFSSDYIFNCPADPAQVPFAGEWHGVKGMQKFFDIFFGIFERQPDTLVPTYTIGPNCAVSHYLDTLYVGGEALPPFWVNLHFQFRDGLVTRLDDEFDTKNAADFLDELRYRLARLQSPT
ncbi:MAG: helix-turn-helix transcriptional regulator [Pirellulales bacterium]|jgi:transcriptional regulator with XRE-family HTH domain